MRVERMTMATENIKPIKKERGAPEQPAQKAEAPQELQQARVLEFKKTERTQKAQELVAEIQRNVPQEQKEELLDRQEARAIRDCLDIGYNPLVRDMVKQAMPGLRNFFKREKLTAHILSYEPEIVDGAMNALLQELNVQRAQKKGETVVRLRKQKSFSKEDIAGEALKLYSAKAITEEELREALSKKVPSEASARFKTREDYIAFAGGVMHKAIEALIGKFFGVQKQTVSRAELAAALDNVPPGKEEQEQGADVLEFPKNDEKNLPPAA